MNLDNIINEASQATDAECQYAFNWLDKKLPCDASHSIQVWASEGSTTREIVNTIYIESKKPLPEKVWFVVAFAIEHAVRKARS